MTEEPNYNITKHARDKLKERYGIEPTPTNIKRLNRIVENNYFHLYFQGRRSVRLIKFRGKYMIVVWDLNEEVLVTIFPDSNNHLQHYIAQWEKLKLYRKNNPN